MALTGINSDWKTQMVNLSEYEGQTINLRFRLTSDRNIAKDGIKIDDVTIAGEGHGIQCKDENK